ncbi:MAG: hypothetical protein IBX44_01380 [Sulfurospirillum sp.]|nr:hypothetical protein [Sulfurospirillum sp.]
MDQFILVIFVGLFIAFILMKQIKHFTDRLPADTQKGDFQKYANFSVAVQNMVRTIKNDIDSAKESENPRFILLEPLDEKESLEELADFLRKLVFFETLLAKNKSAKEIEAELFAILADLDTFVRERCQDGEKLADELKDLLFDDFQKA